MTRRAGAALVAALALTGALSLAASLAGCTPSGDPVASGGAPAPTASAEPDACAELAPAEGAELPGDALGACLESVMLAHGSYRAEAVATNSQTRTSVALVELDPFRVSLESDDDDEPRELYVTDGDGWGRFGDEWVVGTLDPADARGTEVTYQVVLASTTYSPASVQTLLSGSPSWIVSLGANSATGITYVLRPTTAPQVLGVPVTDSAITVDSTFTILEVTGTALFRDEQTTTTQRYSEWGADLDLPDPPG